MSRPSLPCEYCGFPAMGRRHCPCGASYCDEVCQIRDWDWHKPMCQWRQIKKVLSQCGFDRNVVRQILAFVGDVQPRLCVNIYCGL